MHFSYQLNELDLHIFSSQPVTHFFFRLCLELFFSKINLRLLNAILTFFFCFTVGYIHEMKEIRWIQKITKNE